MVNPTLYCHDSTERRPWWSGAGIRCAFTPGEYAAEDFAVAAVRADVDVACRSRKLPSPK